MVYKIIISGKGHEDFYKAIDDSLINTDLLVQIGDRFYRYKKHLLAEVNPKTAEKIGPIEGIEKVVGDYEWFVQPNSKVQQVFERELDKRRQALNFC